MLCAPLLCIFILTLHTWSADSSTSALVLTWSCCCCQFPCSSTVWSSPHPSSNRHVSFTISHTSCQSLLLLWLEAVDAAADRVAYLMVSQSEVALTSQACNEVRRWLATCYVCGTQLQSSRLPGCHPVASSKLKGLVRCKVHRQERAHS